MTKHKTNSLWVNRSWRESRRQQQSSKRALRFQLRTGKV